MGGKADSDFRRDACGPEPDNVAGIAGEPVFFCCFLR